MANKFTYQVLRDTTTDAVIKLTGTFDGASGQEANNARITANALYGALDANNNLLVSGNTAKSYYDIQITGIKGIVNFTTAGTGAVEIFWNGAGTTAAAQYANSATIMHMNGNTDYGNGEQLPSITNNSGQNAAGYIVSANVGKGDIGVYTSGSVANSAYTLIVSLRKNNQHYQRGQFNDPAAFNYPPYGLTP
jgi:hypothetical protein